MSLAISRAKYTGDAMRGYPQGDPGIFDFIGRGLRSAVSFIPGIGPALDLGLDMLSTRGGTPQAAPGGIKLQQAQQMGRPFTSPFPGGAGPGPALAPLPPAGLPDCPAGSMAGYHLNKSDYFLRSGEFVPAGSRYVKNRKRNPANARATSRAISRVVGAKRYATSLQRITIRKRK